MRIQRIILDESVSQRQFSKVIDFLGFDDSSLSEIVDIKEIYPDIPDNEILKHLLNDNLIFITADRVVHNKILLERKKSVYIDKEFVITDTVLKGIILPVKNMNSKVSELQSNYVIEKTDIHERLLPESVQKLRTKRRRIRNYFEGLHDVGNIDISVSKKDNKNKILMGIL